MNPNMDTPQTHGFVEEIKFHELQCHEVVGKGAFGVVSRAKWRGKEVAVKLIETESERKAFSTELKQLSRVAHPNIVKLYGACKEPPTVCLVMEYAEGGSLYNVLHGAGPQPTYTAAHAMSWALQCAKGVEYLHGMKPKALIHRDLKPPNLLLIMGGTVLKICDFGTACDIQTHMTNNKGSAAWMAPEVFEGSNYSEKCDVFSWGIIFWEVITRRKPFDEIGGPAFRIMWAVHNGTRPPLIRNLPKPLEILMTRCWHGNPAERPSMAEVCRIMTYMFQFFSGADQPLEYPPMSESSDSPDWTFSSRPNSMAFSSPPSTYNTSAPASESRSDTLINPDPYIQGDPPPIPPRGNPPPVVEYQNEVGRGQMSAPASLAASRESLAEGRAGTPVEQYKRYSADLTRLSEGDILTQGSNGSGSSTGSHKGRSHRRGGSDEVTQIRLGMSSSPVFVNVNPSHQPFVSPPNNIPHVNTFPGTLHSPNHENTIPQRSISHTPPESERITNVGPRHQSWTPEMGIHPVLPSNGQQPVNSTASDPQQTTGTGLSNTDAFAMSLVLQSLDHQLQPLAPCPTSVESMEIFDQHCKLAEEYLKVQTELSLLVQRKNDLIKEFEQDEHNQMCSTRLAEEFKQLREENESLTLLHKNLNQQVEQIRHEQQKRR
ncbi:mitogen-activated protein kinase kinase kinase 7-like isoform X2 [Saccostrea echinata]|uniref:mitogen-activated protein kinase kinase kinase 7-like isoform X2 n=1 Tax=Saccostrea echinata TaxID=191078 RepID=UPI002A7FB05C|nr:mitogen-activated protein kinase kinase kinase 7-like isoform X2 [Saccostrea echinata]